jgi:hypothetical protein
VPTLQSPADLVTFLRTEAPYPLFMKPIRGSVGGGAAALAGYDATGDSLLLGNGERVPVVEFVEDLDDPKRGKLAPAGYLFQDVVRQHESIVELAGATVCGARIVLLVGDDQVTPIMAAWRVARVGNMTDNFYKGRTGNIMGGVDLETGVVRRFVDGFGLTQRVIEHHPDTGRRLSGFQLPDWSGAVDLCVRGASCFPNLRFQHWDLAFSTEGPQVLEVNTQGGIRVIQRASGVGLRGAKMQDFLAKYGS